MTLSEAKAVLLEHGFTEDEQGRFVPPVRWLTITQALKQVNGPKPDRATIKRHAEKRSFQATKDGRTWKLLKPSFDEWFEAWQRREAERQRVDNEMAIESLGFSYDPAVMMFPDPRKIDLILLDQAYQENEFVRDFMEYHDKLPAVKVFHEVDQKIRQAIGRARKILWVSNQSIPIEVSLSKIKVWIPESDY